MRIVRVIEAWAKTPAGKIIFTAIISGTAFMRLGRGLSAASIGFTLVAVALIASLFVRWPKNLTRSMLAVEFILAAIAGAGDIQYVISQRPAIEIAAAEAPERARIIFGPTEVDRIAGDLALHDLENPKSAVAGIWILVPRSLSRSQCETLGSVDASRYPHLAKLTIPTAVKCRAQFST